MKHLLFAVLSLLSMAAQAQDKVQQWERYERTLTYKTEKANPFTDVSLTAIFVHPSTHDTISVEGFYDGSDKYVIRFMPTQQGEWKYITHSSETTLDGIEGSIVCTEPPAANHGMVCVGNKQNFIYADGTNYTPVGTTSYAWVHASLQRQHQTCKSLSDAGFNKLRFCVFPNNSVEELPKRYPFVNLQRPTSNAQHQTYVWDYTRFSPEFFHHLENCVDSLKQIGIEADLILFTPYDEGLWGFDRMSHESNMRYLKYVVARLSSFSNIWWSMANEWNLCNAKTLNEWLEMSQYVHDLDPYHHLLSIHGGTAVYINYMLPYFTHASIQDQGPLYNSEGAATVRNIYHKPIIFDEVCYEGDHKYRWAQLSGQEMIERMWTGIIGGTYVTHGECFCTRKDKDYYTGFSFLATGGQFQGTAPKRIKFMRSILDSLPEPVCLADQSWDPNTASAGPNDYLLYFGNTKMSSWSFSLPAKNSNYGRLQGGEKFRVEVIDTWNMTTTTYPTIFEAKSAPAKRIVDVKDRTVKLPNKPYLLLHIKRI